MNMGSCSHLKQLSNVNVSAHGIGHALVEAEPNVAVTHGFTDLHGSTRFAIFT